LASNENPFKQAFVLPSLFFLCYFGLWQSAFYNLIQLAFQPSGEHLYNFLTNRGFLVMTVIYFVSLHFFNLMATDKRNEKLDEFIRRSHKDSQLERGAPD
jgi:hypothetical protein